MGNKPSQPTSPATPRTGRVYNARLLTAPIAAVTMATILFFYSRTSIRAAKLNAQKHREADGGQLSWHRESLRQRGIIESVDNDTANIREALLARGKTNEEAKEEVGKMNKKKDTVERYSKEEMTLRELLGKDEEPVRKR